MGIDVGRHQHQVAAIPRERMEDGSWERALVRSIVANAIGFRELLARREGSGLPPAQVRVGCEPTGGYLRPAAESSRRRVPLGPRCVE